MLRNLFNTLNNQEFDPTSGGGASFSGGDDYSDSSVSDEEIDSLLKDSEYSDGPSISEDEGYLAERQEPEPEAEMQARDEQAEPEQEQEPPVEEFEFKANGKLVKANREQILNYASQGYHYSQNMAALKQDRAALEQERSQLQEIQSKYSQVEEYARENPLQWQQILQAVDNGGQVQETSAEIPPQFTEKLNELYRKIDEQQQFIDNFKSEKEIEQQTKQDEALDSEIQSFREKHPELAWDTLDAEGRTLEARVINHALERGIQSFEAAAKDLLFDDILTKRIEQSKKDKFNRLKQDKKNGLVKDRNGQPPRFNLSGPKSKSKNYDSAEDILAELQGSATGG